MRHLGVDPAAGADDVARSHGVRVRTDFFDASAAAEIRAEEGPAHLIYSANTISHISYLDSIFRGIDLLLAPDGLFVFEDRSLADILKYDYFDQIYDEHFYLFSVRSVQAMAARFGFELVDVQHLAYTRRFHPLHGRPCGHPSSRPRPSRNSWRRRKPRGLPRKRRSSGSPPTSIASRRTSSPFSATCVPTADASSDTGPRRGAPR